MNARRVFRGPVLAEAPGRINLIGEHTDYNNGFAMPIALEQRTVVRFDPDSSGRVRLSSEQEGSASEFEVSVEPGAVDGWSAYPAGVLWAMRQAGYPVTGGTLTVSSDVPIGAGLSSSAALECAVLLAVMASTGTEIDRLDMARIAQRAENDFVGAPTGSMDQLASLFGDVHRALLIDFDTSAVQPVLFDPAASGLTLLVVDSNAPHAHSTGEYASRRASCTRGAADLGVDSLRRVQDDDVAASLGRITDETDRRRVRHVLTENSRVLACASAMESGRFDRVGALMVESHESMRDDFEITTPHIDLIAESLVRHGALGARMTGGGFGGCVIALVPTAAVDAVTDAVTADIARGGHPAPTVFTAEAGAGARLT